MKQEGMDAILRGSHILILYTSSVDKYAVPGSFFASSGNSLENLFVTTDAPEQVLERMKQYDSAIKVIHPERLGAIAGERMNICFDGISCSQLPPGLQNNNTILCMYDLSRLDPQRLKELVASHDRLILNTPDRTVLSARSGGEGLVDDAMIERIVKEYLDIVILALIAREPVCGKDILDIIQRNFNVFISPGTIYPLLHRLKKEGYLECEAGIKKKVYRPAKGSERDIRRRLEEHRLACDLMKGFLNSRGV